jgi:hypothetical protein
MGEDIWTSALGDENRCETADMIVDDDGNLVISGYYKFMETDNADGLIVKTNNQGEILWAKHYGGAGADYCKSIQQTDDGGYLVALLAASYSVSGDFDALIVKTDADGNVDWTRAVGTEGYENTLKAIELSNGNYAVIGHTDNPSSAMYDASLIMLNSEGEYLWGKTYGASDIEIVWDMMEHESAIYVTGDTKSMGAGYTDPYILKIDFDGNLLWQYTYGGPLADHGTSLSTTSDGFIVLGGLTASAGAGGLDMLGLKIDKDGELLWSKAYGGDEKEVLFDGIATSDGGYVFAGYTKSFDVDALDIYLVKANSRGDCSCHFEADCSFERLLGIYVTSDFETLNYSPTINTGDVGLEVWTNSNHGTNVLCSHGIAHADSQTPTPAPISTDSNLNPTARKSAEIGIFPNPSLGSVNIDVSQSEEFSTIVLYGVDGQIVFEDLVTNNAQRFEINLANYPVGVYQVKLYSANNVVTKRLILQ